MNPMVEALKKILEANPNEPYMIQGTPSGFFVSIAGESYLVEPDGSYEAAAKWANSPGKPAMQNSEHESDSEEQEYRDESRFSEEDYAKLEAAILQKTVVDLDPDADFGEELWELAGSGESVPNFSPLGYATEPLSGNLPRGYSQKKFDETQWFRVFLKEDGTPAVEITYVPIPPPMWVPTAKAEAKKLWNHTKLHELMTFEEFLEDLNSEDPYIEDIFGGSEIYEFFFELVKAGEAPKADADFNDFQEDPIPVELNNVEYELHIYLHQD